MLRTKRNSLVLIIALLFTSSLARSQASIDNLLPLLVDQDICSSEMGNEDECVNITDGSVYIKATYDTLLNNMAFQSNNPAFQSLFQNSTATDQISENQGRTIELDNVNESGLNITNTESNADYVLSFYPPVSLDETDFYIFQIYDGSTNWLIKLKVNNGEIAASDVVQLQE